MRSRRKRRWPMADFLLELGMDEIPARMIDSGREELAKRVMDLFARERLGSAPQVTAYSTPRRLAVLVTGLAERQEDVSEQLTGPSYKVAFKDGVATPAADAFAKKVGVSVSELTKVSTTKGEYLAANVTRKGRATSEVLAELLPKEIGGIYWAKSMYWRGKNTERFVRPLRWMMALLDGKLVPLEFAGIKAGTTSRGHRIMSDGTVRLDAPGDYAKKLEKMRVIVSGAQREKKIVAALDQAVQSVGKARWREDKALLSTVVNLTEFPSAILGSFDAEYLSLPEEVLVTVMRDHQKYFAVEDAGGKLAPHFLAVLNVDGDPDGLIRHGNERVLRARFNDARFFWETDQKIPLSARVEMLKAVTFQKDLGSYYEKARRIAHVVTILAADVESGGENGPRGSARKIARNELYEAAWLAKTDLTTELVKEFTELQGVVGGLYARAQGLKPAIADAIYQHYQPKSMEDAAPKSLEGALLSIADKADSIAGMFALGLIPSGSKDPFALRRQANGIVKTIAEHELPIDLGGLFALALAAYKGSDAEKRFTKVDEYAGSVAAFFRERLEFYLRDVRGFKYDEVNAVLAVGADNIPDAVQRSEALAAVRKSADFETIATSFKRIKNILRQAQEKSGAAVESGFEPSLATDDAERALHAMVEKIAPEVVRLRREKDHGAALREVAKLRPVLDTFFDKVMVMAEDQRVRENRLALLSRVLRDFSTVADFSEIVSAG